MELFQETWRPPHVSLHILRAIRTPYYCCRARETFDVVRTLRCSHETFLRPRRAPLRTLLMNTWPLLGVGMLGGGSQQALTINSKYPVCDEQYSHEDDVWWRKSLQLSEQSGNRGFRLPRLRLTMVDNMERYLLSVRSFLPSWPFILKGNF